MAKDNPRKKMADVMGELEQAPIQKLFSISNLREPVTTHITLPKGDYRIDFDIKVEPTGILEIAPGTTLRFGTGCGLTSRGQLIAAGKLENRITFISRLATWRNITLEGDSSRGSLLRYCNIFNGAGMYPPTTLGSIPPCSFGGAISAAGTELAIEDCLIDGNTASSGGAISISRSKCAILRTTLKDNHVDGSSLFGGLGGAIYASFGSSLSIRSSVISHNASACGAGVSADSARLSIEDTIFARNASAVGGLTSSGGGISISHSEAEISGSMFWGNFSKMGGGLYISDSNHVILVDTKILGNKALSSGAGMQLCKSDIALRNCQILLNRVTQGYSSVDDGAGIYAIDCDPRLKSSPVLLNYHNNITHFSMNN